jgi:hypothetical protein
MGVHEYAVFRAWVANDGIGVFRAHDICDDAVAATPYSEIDNPDIENAAPDHPRGGVSVFKNCKA